MERKKNMNSMLSSTLTPHTSAYAVHGRPAPKDVERFRNGSVSGLYERSIYERAIFSEVI